MKFFFASSEVDRLCYCLNHPSASTSMLRSSSKRLLNHRLLSTYTRPLPPNSLQVYDEAISYLDKDTQSKLSQLSHLSKDPSIPQDVLTRLEVNAWVNDPATRSAFEKGEGDLSKPVFRHLAERRWRSKGALAVLVSLLSLTYFARFLPNLFGETDAKNHSNERYPRFTSNHNPRSKPSNLNVGSFFPHHRTRKLYPPL